MSAGRFLIYVPPEWRDYAASYRWGYSHARAKKKMQVRSKFDNERAFIAYAQGYLKGEARRRADDERNRQEAEAETELFQRR